MNESGENDIHIVSYYPGSFSDPEALKRLKTFRKFNTNNTKEPGDIYLLRQAETVFNSNKPNVDLCDFPYSCERLIKADDLISNIE